MSIRTTARFSVGDHVQVPLVQGLVKGFITEDLGPIGVRGRRLYRVEVPVEPYEPMHKVMAEEDLRPAPDEPEPPLDRAAIIDYFKNGGLILILRSNMAGGKNQPRVWLCRDTLGNVTHTFIPERGLIGGETVPFHALQGDKIFTPEEDQVLEYLETFGLTRREASAILAEVGTAP